jgi:hypothetical protein
LELVSIGIAIASEADLLLIGAILIGVAIRPDALCSLYTRKHVRNLHTSEMSHRGETLHKDVCCIADLKELGSKRLSPMVRGEQSPCAVACPQGPEAKPYRLLQ